MPLAIARFVDCCLQHPLPRPVLPLNQNWNRDYDPLTGKYIESDPIGLKGGVNTYEYVHQDPLLYSDPSGLLSQIVASCVCSYMKSSGYVAWKAWSDALGNRSKPGPWDDPVLRPCENYLYAYAAVVDYGDPAWYVDVGVFGHRRADDCGLRDAAGVELGEDCRPEFFAGWMSFSSRCWWSQIGTTQW